MPEIKIICNDGEQDFHGKSKLYRGLKEDTAFFFLLHPRRGRVRCYIDKDNQVTARRRPFRKGELFIIGRVVYDFGKPTALINQNLDKVYSPVK